MADDMQVVGLTETRLSDLLTQWEEVGVSKSEILQFFDYSEEPRIDCCAVEDNQGNILALFEKRDALKSYKNMSILLSPEIDVQEVGDYAIISQQLEKIIVIIAKIFDHFLESPLEERGMIKIWNDRAKIYAILASFANYLAKHYADRYSVKLYRNWIEVQQQSEAKS